MQNNQMSTPSSRLPITAFRMITEIEKLSLEIKEENINAKIVISQDLHNAFVIYYVQNFYEKFEQFYPIGEINSVPVEIDPELQGFDWGLRERGLTKCKRMI